MADRRIRETPIPLTEEEIPIGLGSRALPQYNLDELPPDYSPPVSLGDPLDLAARAELLRQQEMVPPLMEEPLPGIPLEEAAARSVLGEDPLDSIQPERDPLVEPHAPMQDPVAAAEMRIQAANRRHAETRAAQYGLSPHLPDLDKQLEQREPLTTYGRAEQVVEPIADKSDTAGLKPISMSIMDRMRAVGIERDMLMHAKDQGLGVPSDKPLQDLDRERIAESTGGGIFGDSNDPTVPLWLRVPQDIARGPRKITPLTLAGDTSAANARMAQGFSLMWQATNIVGDEMFGKPSIHVQAAAREPWSLGEGADALFDAATGIKSLPLSEAPETDAAVEPPGPTQLFTRNFTNQVLKFGQRNWNTAPAWTQNLVSPFEEKGSIVSLDPVWVKKQLGVDVNETLTLAQQQRLAITSSAADNPKDLRNKLRSKEWLTYITTGEIEDPEGPLGYLVTKPDEDGVEPINPIFFAARPDRYPENKYIPYDAAPQLYEKACRYAVQETNGMQWIARLRHMASLKGDTNGLREAEHWFKLAHPGVYLSDDNRPWLKKFMGGAVEITTAVAAALTLTAPGYFAQTSAGVYEALFGNRAAREVDPLNQVYDNAIKAQAELEHFSVGMVEWAVRDLPTFATGAVGWLGHILFGPQNQYKGHMLAGLDPEKYPNITKAHELFRTERKGFERKWMEEPAYAVLDSFIVSGCIARFIGGTTALSRTVSSAATKGMALSESLESMARLTGMAPAGADKVAVSKFFKNALEGQAAAHEAYAKFMSPKGLLLRQMEAGRTREAAKATRVAKGADLKALESYAKKAGLTLEEAGKEIAAMGPEALVEHMGSVLKVFGETFTTHQPGARRLFWNTVMSPSTLMMKNMGELQELILSAKAKTAAETLEIMDHFDMFAGTLVKDFGLAHDVAYSTTLMLLQRQGPIGQAVGLSLIAKTGKAVTDAVGGIGEVSGSPMKVRMGPGDDIGKAHADLAKDVLTRLPDKLPEMYEGKPRIEVAKEIAMSAIKDAVIDFYVEAPSYPWRPTAKGNVVDAPTAAIVDAYRTHLRPFHQDSLRLSYRTMDMGGLSRESFLELAGDYVKRIADLPAWASIGKKITRARKRAAATEKKIVKGKAKGPPTASDAKHLDDLERNQQWHTERADAYEEMTASAINHPEATQVSMQQWPGAFGNLLKKRFPELVEKKSKLRKTGGVGTVGGAEAMTEMYDMTRKAVLANVFYHTRLSHYLDMISHASTSANKGGNVSKALLEGGAVDAEMVDYLKVRGINVPENITPGGRLQAAIELCETQGFVSLKPFMEGTVITETGKALWKYLDKRGWLLAEDTNSIAGGWGNPATNAMLPDTLMISPASNIALKGTKGFNPIKIIEEANPTSAIEKKLAKVGRPLKAYKDLVGDMKANIVVYSFMWGNWIRDFLTNITAVAAAAGLRLTDTDAHHFGSDVHIFRDPAMDTLFEALGMSTGNLASEFGPRAARSVGKFHREFLLDGAWWDKPLSHLTTTMSESFADGLVRGVGRTVKKGLVQAYLPARTALGQLYSRYRMQTDTIFRAAVLQKRLKGALGIDLWKYQQMRHKQYTKLYTKLKKKGLPPKEAADTALAQMTDSTQLNKLFTESPYYKVAYNDFIRRNEGVIAERMMKKRAHKHAMEATRGEAQSVATKVMDDTVRMDLKSPALDAVTSYGIFPFITWSARVIPLMGDYTMRHPVRAVTMGNMMQGLNRAAWAVSASDEDLERMQSAWGDYRYLIPIPGSEGTWETSVSQATTMSKKLGVWQKRDSGRVRAPIGVDTMQFSWIAGIGGTDPTSGIPSSLMMEFGGGRESYPTRWEGWIPTGGGWNFSILDKVDGGIKRFIDVIGGMAGKYTPALSPIINPTGTTGPAYANFVIGGKKESDQSVSHQPSSKDDAFVVGVMSSGSARPFWKSLEAPGLRKKLQDPWYAGPVRGLGYRMFPMSSAAVNIQQQGAYFDDYIRYNAGLAKELGTGKDVFTATSAMVLRGVDAKVGEVRAKLEMVYANQSLQKINAAKLKRADEFAGYLRRKMVGTKKDPGFLMKMKTLIAEDVLYRGGIQNPATLTNSAATTNRMIQGMRNLSETIGPIMEKYVDQNIEIGDDLDKAFREAGLDIHSGYDDMQKYRKEMKIEENKKLLNK